MALAALGSCGLSQPCLLIVRETCCMSDGKCCCGREEAGELPLKWCAVKHFWFTRSRVRSGKGTQCWQSAGELPGAQPSPAVLPQAQQLARSCSGDSCSSSQDCNCSSGTAAGAGAGREMSPCRNMLSSWYGSLVILGTSDLTEQGTTILALQN